MSAFDGTFSSPLDPFFKRRLDRIKILNSAAEFTDNLGAKVISINNNTNFTNGVGNLNVNIDGTFKAYDQIQESSPLPLDSEELSRNYRRHVAAQIQRAERQREHTREQLRVRAATASPAPVTTPQEAPIAIKPVSRGPARAKRSIDI